MDKHKAKSNNPFSANTQSQAQASKQDKRQSNQQGDLSVTGGNTTEVAKKDKTKNLSYIKYCTCKKKGHYADKYSIKPKN